MDFNIGIVIPLKSKQVSKNWEQVSALLRDTVNSVLSQNDRAFRLVVVGHECPEFLQGLNQNGNPLFCEFKEFSPPNQDVEDGAQLQLAYEFDRCSKIAKGMKELSSHSDISHWYALDADDIISRNFVKEIKSLAKDEDAFILTKGFFHYKSSGRMTRTKEFNSYCGSSLISAAHLTDIPDVIDDTAYKATIFGKYSHVHVKDDLLKQNFTLTYPMNELVTYVRDNGENISKYYLSGYLKKFKFWLKSVLFAVKLTDQEKLMLNVK